MEDIKKIFVQIGKYTATSVYSSYTHRTLFNYLDRFISSLSLIDENTKPIPVPILCSLSSISNSSCDVQVTCTGCAKKTVTNIFPRYKTLLRPRISFTRIYR